MKRTITMKGLFRQMLNGLPLAELYEIEQAVGDLIDQKEENTRDKNQTSNLIETIIH